MSSRYIQTADSRIYWYKKRLVDMRSLELTYAITALAGAIACNLTLDEIALVAGIFVQIGDTLATIAASENLCCSKKEEDA